MSSFEWPPSSGGGSGGGGIQTINADATADQLIVTASTGTDFTIVTSGGTTTIAIPTASSTKRGLLSSADWTTFNSKQAALTIGNLTDAGTDGITVTGGTGAVIGSGTSLAQHVADTTHNGYLSSTDWNTFNGKQSALTTGNLTDAGTDGITVTGGTGAVIGSGTSLAQHVADNSHNGYLSSTDWITFNAKQASGNYITALTGDVTASGPGSVAATVAKIQGTTVSGTTGTTNVVFSASPTMTNPVVGTQSQGDSSTKAASTSYVDVAVANAIAGVNPAVAVQAATTAAGDTSGFTYNNGASGIGAFFTGSVNTAITIDGYTFTALGQRLLVKNDTQSPSGAFNGVYYVTQVQTGILAPILTRALDYDTPADMNNTGAIPVINGTVNGTTSWVLTSLVVTVGTTPLTFTKFTRNPADYLLVANNLSDVASAPTSINNILPTQGSSSGQFLTTNGSACSWGTPGGGGAPNARYSGYYPWSASNYWDNTQASGSTYVDYTPHGTIPNPTVYYNTGFTTPTIPSGNLPGITFTAPFTGTIWVDFTISIVAAASNSSFRLFESVTSTEIDGTYGIMASSPYPQIRFTGFLDVIATTSYTFVTQYVGDGGSHCYIGGNNTAPTTTPILRVKMFYVH